VDRSFVAEVTDNPDDAAIVRTIITLGHNLGLKVIAEGVESEEQRVYLARLGCHAYQGYLTSRPLPVNEFESLLTAMNKVAILYADCAGYETTHYSPSL